jgi:hypothetical protein
MQQDQTVSEMAEEALERQAKALAHRGGKSLEDARQVVSDTKAGRQLKGLANGEHRHEKAQNWQGRVFWDRAEERLKHLFASKALALCSRTPLLVARGLHGVVGRQGGACAVLCAAGGGTRKPQGMNLLLSRSYESVPAMGRGGPFFLPFLSPLGSWCIRTEECRYSPKLVEGGSLKFVPCT